MNSMLTVFCTGLKPLPANSALFAAPESVSIKPKSAAWAVMLSFSASPICIEM